MTWKNRNSFSRPDPGPATAELDRRLEPRVVAAGPATLVVLDGGWTIQGELVDLSSSGFRLSHGHGGLSTGTEVSFHFEDQASGETRRGRAKVCWNRISAGAVDSGFLITSNRP